MKKILIIDDDIHINDMLEKVLTQEGYAVSHAYSGTEVLLSMDMVFRHIKKRWLFA